MKYTYLATLLAIFSTSAAAANDCKLFNEKNSTYLATSKQKIDVSGQNLKLSALKLNDYCLLYEDNEQWNKSVKFYNKNTGETIAFSNMTKVLQSPNEKFVAVASGDEENKVTRITMLDKKGLKSFKQQFDEELKSSRFRLSFSSNSQYLNFYEVREDNIDYNSLNLKTGVLAKNVAPYTVYNSAMKSSIDTVDASIAVFIPVNDSEFAASTNTNHLGYYKNGIALWTKKMSGQQALTRLIAVGNIYLVVVNAEGGVDLYRKSDGKKFTVLTKAGDTYTTGISNISSSRFIGPNKILMTYVTSGNESKAIIDLDKKTAKDVTNKHN